MIRALGKRVALPVGTGGQQDGSHGGGLADAVGRHVAGDELHGVVNRQTGGDAAARRVDVQMDIRLRVIRLQEQHLSDQAVGDFVVDLRTQKDDAVFQQPAVNVIDAFFATAFFNDVGNRGIASRLRQMKDRSTSYIERVTAGGLWSFG